MVTQTPILAYYKQNVKIIEKTNSSYYANSKVFLQLRNDELLHFIAFF